MMRVVLGVDFSLRKEGGLKINATGFCTGREALEESGDGVAYSGEPTRMMFLVWWDSRACLGGFLIPSSQLS